MKKPLNAIFPHSMPRNPRPQAAIEPLDALYRIFLNLREARCGLAVEGSGSSGVGILGLGFGSRISASELRISLICSFFSGLGSGICTLRIFFKVQSAEQEFYQYITQLMGFNTTQNPRASSKNKNRVRAARGVRSGLQDLEGHRTKNMRFYTDIFHGSKSLLYRRLIKVVYRFKGWFKRCSLTKGVLESLKVEKTSQLGRPWF